jgi:2-polyprenyl-3-methyl-5-hydroxy-6-metoxy-1,4-benzoquinol methylase
MTASFERYYEAYWEGPEPSPLQDRFAPVRLALLRELIGSTRRRVLDAGCGAGDLLAELRADGHETSGFDLSGNALALAARRHPGLELAQHSAEELPWPVVPGTCDVVVAFEVVEHLFRPSSFVAGAHAALKVGGRLALSTPHHGTAKNLALALRGFERHFDPEGEHIRFFTDRGLRRLLESAGFDVEEMRHYGRIPGLRAGTFVWARKR